MIKTQQRYRETNRLRGIAAPCALRGKN